METMNKPSLFNKEPKKEDRRTKKAKITNELIKTVIKDKEENTKGMTNETVNEHNCIITPELLREALPKYLRSHATQAFADRLNNIDKDPNYARVIRENFLSYTKVMNDGSIKMENYLNAVKYCTFKLMGYSNQDAYIRAFPDRYANMLAQGKGEKELSAFVSLYHRTKTVATIMEQALVPTWILNQDAYQEAINTQVDLMRNSKSDRVKCMAADSILTHLEKPKEAGALINIDMRETNGIDELKEALVGLAKKQQELIREGVSPKTIAEQRMTSNLQQYQEDKDIIDI